MIKKQNNKENKYSQTYTYKRKHPKSSKKKRTGEFWLKFLEGMGWFIFAGILLLYVDSSKRLSIIINAKPVAELSTDMSGIVRLEGPAFREKGVTDEGVIRNRFILLQKEHFRWECSRSSCDYKPDKNSGPEVWGGFNIHGLDVQAEQYYFYKSWLPLGVLTVEPAYLSKIYEEGTSRPLLEETYKSSAYGYHSVSSGEWITVIGQAMNGQLHPISYPGTDNVQPVILIGDSVDGMISKEKGYRTGFMIIGSILLLLLLPKTISRIRHLYRRINSRKRKTR